jgi:3-oxoacyl-[acyl-carrier protein] reductase
VEDFVMENQRKVAVVTGGSRGIGRAIVVALAEAGYDVAFSYASNKAAASEVEATVKVFGRDVLAIQADASNQLDAQLLIDQTQSTWGRIDVLVNNAGITKDTLLIRMNDEDWQRVLDTNLTGMFYTARAAAKYMMKQRSGNIINISSVIGVHGNAGQANYAASKAGIIGFTKSIAKELGARNINVNAVAPGFIVTDMTEKVPTEKILEHIPLGRLGSPDDIAKTVLFLVTSGSYITGQVIQVDGGLVL